MRQEDGQSVLQPLTGARWFLGLMVLVVVVARLAQYLWQYSAFGLPTVFGQPPGVYVALTGALACVVVWWRFEGNGRARGWLLLFLFIMAVMWVTVMAVSYSHGDAVMYDVWLVPLFVTLAYLKAPTAGDFSWAISKLAQALTSALLGVLIGEWLGVIPRPRGDDGLIGFELSNYWLPVSELLGIEGRWIGPFMSANAAVLMFLVAFGAKMSRWWRVVIASTSVLVLLLTSSRTSYLAVLVGAAVLLVLTRNPLTQRFPRPFLVSVLGSALVISIIAAVVRNPGMTGRTRIWRTYFAIWQENPILGVGTSGVFTSEIGNPGPNAHNLWVDALTKYGLFALMVLLALTTVLVLSSSLAARKSIGLPATLLAAFFVISAAQSDIMWSSTSWVWLWVFLSGGCACASLSHAPDPYARELILNSQSGSSGD